MQFLFRAAKGGHLVVLQWLRHEGVSVLAAALQFWSGYDSKVARGAIWCWPLYFVVMFVVLTVVATLRYYCSYAKTASGKCHREASVIS